MKILIVFSGNKGYISHFIKEQADAISALGNEILFFPILGKSMHGYLKNLTNLKKMIENFSPDIIHAHYGLSGLLAVLQRKVPVITTFHNGETLSFKSNLFASLVPFLSQFDIYVAEHIRKKMIFKKPKNYMIIPCGIDLNTMKVSEVKEKTNQHFVDPRKKNVLFGGAFNEERKNFALAKRATSLLTKYDINLIELKGYNRDEVSQLLNTCDLALLTSKSEGSPQFIKEAMACNCPIVATDVGDIKKIILGVEGCFITNFDAEDVAEKINLALKYNKRTNGRDFIKHFDNEQIAIKIVELYQKVIRKKYDFNRLSNG